MEIALDAGDDVSTRATSSRSPANRPLPQDLQALTKAGITRDQRVDASRRNFFLVELDAPTTERSKMMDRLDDQDDVQNVSVNFNISDEIMAALDKS